MIGSLDRSRMQEALLEYVKLWVQVREIEFHGGVEMALEEQLQQLFEHFEVDLGDYAWFYESERWAELVFCLLNQCVDQDPALTRQAVGTLKYLDLLRLENMGILADPSQERTVVTTYTLEQHGFSEQEARRAVHMLAGAARAIQERYDGKIQRCVREHGLALRDELVEAFRNQALDDESLRYALAHWLQNAFGIPVSLQHEAVMDFCEANGVTLEELLRAADELDLNVALVDDLLDLDREQKAAGIAEVPEQLPKGV